MYVATYFNQKVLALFLLIFIFAVPFSLHAEDSASIKPQNNISTDSGVEMKCHYGHANCGGRASCRSDYFLMNISTSDGGDYGDIRGIRYGKGGYVDQSGCNKGTGVYITCCKIVDGNISD